MKSNLSAWVSGFIFALGLGVSGMTDTQKVIGFLDVFGSWDPSLILVMAGSISVHFFAYKLIRRRPSPLFSTQWHVPKKSQITPSLITGSVLFGVGWGLVGYCPGPAMSSLSTLELRPLAFVMSMLTGMFLFKLLDKRRGFNR